MSLFNSALIGAALAVGLTAAAQAQMGPNIANLPPEGPRASSHGFQGGNVHAVAPSEAYPGPGPGGQATGAMQHFDKPAGWDANLALHPYDREGPALTEQNGN